MISRKENVLVRALPFYQKREKFHHKQKKEYKRDKNIIKCRSKQQVSIKLSPPIKNKKHIRRICNEKNIEAIKEDSRVIVNKSSEIVYGYALT